MEKKFQDYTKEDVKEAVRYLFRKTLKKCDHIVKIEDIDLIFHYKLSIGDQSMLIPKEWFSEDLRKQIENGQ